MAYASMLYVCHAMLELGKAGAGGVLEAEQRFFVLPPRQQAGRAGRHGRPPVPALLQRKSMLLLCRESFCFDER